MTDDIVENILRERYYQPGETCWEDITNRVTNALFDKKFEQNDNNLCKEYLNTKKFIFNSPALMNAGTEMGQLSACFCLPIKDDMSDIYDTIRKSALIFQSGGGVGINWSTLRPEGASVGKYTVKNISQKKDYGEEHFSNYMYHATHTNGIRTASGPIAFMKSFDAMVETVKSAGKRRGAAIAVLNDNHPDILKFITAKNEEGKLSNFNISVLLTDEFMKCVEANATWNLMFDGKLYQRINARDMFNTICEAAWTRAEPGVLFYDTINKDNPMKHEFGDIVTVNPCVTGDTLILTNKGYIPIIELIGKETTIWNGYEWSVVTPIHMGDNQPLMKIGFSDGTYVKCTPNHRFILKDFTFKDANDLTVGDMIPKFEYPIINGDKNLEYAYIKGFYCGDGGYHKFSQRHMIYLYNEKRSLEKYLIVPDKSLTWNDLKNDRTYIRYIDLEFNKEFVPSAQYTIESRIKWLSGLLDAAGSKNSKEGSLSISSINEEFLFNIKLMLSEIGVKSHVGLMKDETVKNILGGNYYCKPCYRLIIAASHVKKLNKLGLNCHRINTTCNPGRDSTRYIRIKSISWLDDKQDVYCFTEKLRGFGIFNGILASNCGEQPLCVDYITGGGEACVLGSIDISKFVEDKGNFTECYNSIELEKIIRFAVRALDRVIEVNKYPLPEIKDCVMKGRKIGLGVMGWADALIKMEIPYGSNESIDVANGIMEIIRKVADDESVKIGEGKKKNACVLTCAPSGTISIFGGCSSGIEPNFGWVYKRSTWVDGEKKTYRMVHPLFEKKFSNYINYKGILDHVEKYGTLQGYLTIPQKDIDIFCVAKDISPSDHIKMQSAFQKHIDAAVSKTINCPESITVQDIYNIYMEAWKSGCKGLTVYREGSRQDVVLEPSTSTKQEEVSIEISNPVKYKLLTHPRGRILPKTPREIPATTFKRNSGCGKMMITIGEMDSQPHSVNIVNKGGCDALTQALAELTALALRWGIPQWDITKVLMGIRCSAAMKNPKSNGKSCADILGKILYEYFPHSDAPAKEDIEPKQTTISDFKLNTISCPECGESLIFESGCVICKSCGFSKCS